MNIKDNLKKIFKKKDYKKISFNNKKSEFLREKRIKYNSIQNINNDEIITVDNKKYNLYKLGFLQEQGFNKAIEQQNYEKIILFCSSLNSNFKIYTVDETKNTLKDTIKKLAKKITDNSSKKYNQVIKNRIHIMQLFNKQEYKTYYILVDVRNYEFETKAKEVFKIEKITGKKLILFFHNINNKYF